VKRVQSLIPSICTTLLIAGCSSDLPTSPDAAAPRTPSPMVSKPITVLPGPGPRPGTSRWVRELSNPWLGFVVGKVFHYRAETPEGVETTVVEVTATKKTIQGVSTTVVHDQVSLNGSLIEDTYDWYAQDRDGNVWYFGEDSRQIEDNVVIGTEGSWEAGVNGAQPGIVMLANPKVGMKYQQEFAPGVAEDMARIHSLSESVQVPYGNFDNCLETIEWTPLDKKSRESKFYALGVGLVLTIEGKGSIRDELIPIGP
jgi:hypothetical protein